MSCWLDKTFCVSPNCQNKCGRKMTEEQKAYVETNNYLLISCAKFCDENGELINEY